MFQSGFHSKDCYETWQLLLLLCMIKDAQVSVPIKIFFLNQTFKKQNFKMHPC